MADCIRYNDPSKGPFKTRVVEGMVFMEDLMKRELQGKPVEEHIEDIKNMAIRDDDIIICAYPKCGKYLYMRIW